ncbi:MAG: PIG-L deacetylase family protein [Burkholderiaceae bacterium]
MAWTKQFVDAIDAQLPMRLNDLVLPHPMNMLVLAPHPDDFDAIAVSMCFFQQQGHAIHVAVLTSGVNGVEDGWNGAYDALSKTMLREAEQRNSCSFFGLPEERLRFLRLWEQADGEADDDERLRQAILAVNPDCVFLPHGNDSNRTHRRTFETFDAIAAREGLDVLAFLNLDAKTLSMRSDVTMHFGESDAAWKAEMLRLHRSQQDRNLRTRGHGFDDRVLRINRNAALAGGYKDGYAEVFELRKYGRLA